MPASCRCWWKATVERCVSSSIALAAGRVVKLLVKRSFDDGTPAVVYSARFMPRRLLISAAFAGSSCCQLASLVDRGPNAADGFTPSALAVCSITTVAGILSATSRSMSGAPEKDAPAANSPGCRAA